MRQRPSLRHGATAAICAAAVAGMVGLAYAADPLYDAFCRITGFGGTTQTATKAPSHIAERAIEVRFDANVSPSAPLRFAPMERRMDVRLGETALAFYRVENLSDAPVTAVATYNVTPHKTGVYFQKLECFCFQDRVIPPGESIELPVVFFVDPELAGDRETEEVRSITLSYTFFRSERAGQNAAALPTERPAPIRAAALGANAGAR